MPRSGEGIGLAVFSGTLLLASVFALGATVGVEIDNGDKRVNDVQITNEQLAGQLGLARGVGHLVLNDQKHTFRFQSGQETCTGEYEGEKAAAHVVGDLECTQTVPVGR